MTRRNTGLKPSKIKNPPCFSTEVPAFVRWNRGKSFVFPLACHRAYEFQFIKHGRGKYYIDGKTYNFGSSHLVVIQPGEVHSFIPQPGVWIEKAQILFRRSWLKPILHFLDIDESFPHSIRLTNHTALCMEMLVNRIREENARREENWERMAYDLFCEFLIHAKRANDQPVKPLKASPLFMQLCQYIEANFADPRLNITGVSKKFGYSLPYLSALFKEVSGIGIKQYLLQFRILTARHILDENPLFKIESAARQVGFYHYRTFSRAFNRLTGVSPEIYHNNCHPNHK